MNNTGPRAMAVFNIIGLLFAGACVLVGHLPLALFCGVIHGLSLGVALSQK